MAGSEGTVGERPAAERPGAERPAAERPAAERPTGRTRRLLVYSSTPAVRDQVRNALGSQPLGDDVQVEYVPAGSGAEVVEICDRGGVDLAILDGESHPTGGMGLARQLRDELTYPPPTLLLLGRRDDAWLATWSRADGVVSYPLDPFRLTEAVTDLLRRFPPAAAIAG